jgi:hypothetical protein
MSRSIFQLLTFFIIGTGTLSKKYKCLLQPYDEIVENPDFSYRFINYKDLNYHTDIGFMEKTLHNQINDPFL